ncbi:hypothetical protein N9Q18_00980 [bacterium]|jgi:hypothetical protein|nr:hypothetical protein [bacterium]
MGARTGPFRFPTGRDETPFWHEPFAGHEDQYGYDPEHAAEVLHDYNTHDIAI